MCLSPVSPAAPKPIFIHVISATIRGSEMVAMGGWMVVFWTEVPDPPGKPQSLRSHKEYSKMQSYQASIQ